MDKLMFNSGEGYTYKDYKVSAINPPLSYITLELSRSRRMPLIGEEFPDFTAKSTIGEINFHEWLGNSWGIVFSHPSDFTPVCTTELARMTKLMPEFEARNVKVIALSIDNLESHARWIEDIKSYAGYTADGFPFPIISDVDRILSFRFGMLDRDELDTDGMPLTARAVFVIDPNKKFRLSILYPATTGRNFDEILRVVDSLQLTDKADVATPVDWKHGGQCMVLPSVPADQIPDKFPNATVVELPSGLSYLRETPCPHT